MMLLDRYPEAGAEAACSMFIERIITNVLTVVTKYPISIVLYQLMDS
jgi:hypothetical protein